MELISQLVAELEAAAAAAAAAELRPVDSRRAASLCRGLAVLRPPPRSGRVHGSGGTGCSCDARGLRDDLQLPSPRSVLGSRRLDLLCAPPYRREDGEGGRE